jgi:hypothetical protein
VQGPDVRRREFEADVFTERLFGDVMGYLARRGHLIGHRNRKFRGKVEGLVIELLRAAQIAGQTRRSLAALPETGGTGASFSRYAASDAAGGDSSPSRISTVGKWD